MGRGIAQVYAQKGYTVKLCDAAPSQLEKALSIIEKNLQLELEKNRIDLAHRDQALSRICLNSDLSALSKASLVIEAVNEDADLKRQIFMILDGICADHAILASNTSSISITQLAGVTGRPHKVVGMHFMNPVPVMKLVEVVKGTHTSAETISETTGWVRRLEKVPVEVNDSPGFVSNRVLLPMINEAIFCIFEGVGTVKAVDEIMKLGMNHPMGPLALADLIGLDVCLDIMETLYQGFGDSKYRPCPLLKKMVAAGLLGRKSGEGFYRYSQ